MLIPPFSFGSLNPRLVFCSNCSKVNVVKVDWKGLKFNDRLKKVVNWALSSFIISTVSLLWEKFGNPR